MTKPLLQPGLLLLTACLLFPLQPEASETDRATFVVHCYSVGVEALQGRPGVISVEPGWHRANEVDRVVYDPEKISRQQLETWLEESGTYIRTLETSTQPE